MYGPSLLSLFSSVRSMHAAVDSSVEVDVFPPATVPAAVMMSAVVAAAVIMSATMTAVGRRAAACQVVWCSAVCRPAVLLAVASVAAASHETTHVKWCTCYRPCRITAPCIHECDAGRSLLSINVTAGSAVSRRINRVSIGCVGAAPGPAAHCSRTQPMQITCASRGAEACWGLAQRSLRLGPHPQTQHPAPAHAVDMHTCQETGLNIGEQSQTAAVSQVVQVRRQSAHAS